MSAARATALYHRIAVAVAQSDAVALLVPYGTDVLRRLSNTAISQGAGSCNAPLRPHALRDALQEIALFILLPR